jgi:hypothetical protein
MYDVLWNCEQLTEGFDEPALSALLLARPTKSTGLYTQVSSSSSSSSLDLLSLVEVSMFCQVLC